MQSCKKYSTFLTGNTRIPVAFLQLWMHGFATRFIARSFFFLGRLTPLEISQTIREEIQKKTSCPASAGIASNILLARMCTKVAKPNGQFHLQDENTAEFIGACYGVFPQVSLSRANVYMFEDIFS